MCPPWLGRGARLCLRRLLRHPSTGQAPQTPRVAARRQAAHEDSLGILIYEGERPSVERGDYLISLELTRAKWVRLIEACPPGTIGLWTAAVADARSRTAN